MIIYSIVIKISLSLFFFVLAKEFLSSLSVQPKIQMLFINIVPIETKNVKARHIRIYFDFDYIVNQISAVEPGGGHCAWQVQGYLITWFLNIAFADLKRKTIRHSRFINKMFYRYNVCAALDTICSSWFFENMVFR